MNALSERSIMRPYVSRMVGTGFVLLLSLAGPIGHRIALGQAAAKPGTFQPDFRFQGYDTGDGTARALTFQINVRPDQAFFLKLGDTVPHTTVRLTSFDAASEQLTVTDTATNRVATLPLPKPVEVILK
jgi:hypothetical protein